MSLEDLVNSGIFQFSGNRIDSINDLLKHIPSNASFSDLVSAAD